MASSGVQTLSQSQSASLWTFHGDEKSTSRFLVVALGVIAMIGSLVANGILFSHLGYTSFAIGGSGFLVGGALIVGGFYAPSCSTQFDEVHKESKMMTVRLEEGKHYQRREHYVRKNQYDSYTYEYVEVSPKLYELLKADSERFGLDGYQFRDISNFGGFTGIFIRTHLSREEEKAGVDAIIHILNDLEIKTETDLSLPKRMKLDTHFGMVYEREGKQEVFLWNKCGKRSPLTKQFPWSNQPAWQLLEQIADISDAEIGYYIAIKPEFASKYRHDDIFDLLKQVELDN